MIDRRINFFLKVVVAVAKKHQTVGDSQPLSMATLFTPAGVRPSDEEMVFRRRAIEVGKQFSSDVRCEEAIAEVVKQIVSEGLHCRLGSVDNEVVTMLENQIEGVDRSEERMNILKIYHYVVWKTAGDNKWTLRRNPGECNTIPYLPHMLLGNHMKMEAETVLGSTRTALVEETDLSSGVIRAIVNSEELPQVSQSNCENSKAMVNPQDWTEVGLMEFVNGCLPYEHRLGEERSQPITKVITSKERKLTWKEAQDSDDQRGEIVFANQGGQGEGEGRRYYVRTKSDVRTLYEMRPPSMKNMVLGFFASRYRRIQQGGHGLEAARDKIDPSTGLGPDSTERGAGDDHLMAPQCMKLTNEVLMIKRSGRDAVLHFLYDGKARKHGNQVLWESWQFLEEIRDQDQDVTEQQTRTRLEVFPMSKEEQEYDSD